MDCTSPDMDRALRDRIDAVLWKFQTAPEQATALEEIRSVHSHSVRPVQLEAFCEIFWGQTIEYDCFTFALDLIDCPERIAVREYAPRTIGPAKRPGIANVLPGPNFLASLLLTEQTSMESCRDGDVVVYYDKFGNAQHAGKLIGGLIVSKWGMKGALWQHELCDVPSSYGTSAKFYSQQPRDLVRRRWLEYLPRLALRVSGFTTLVDVMWEHTGKNLSPNELLDLASNRMRTRS